MGLGNCADPLTALFQEKHPGHPFLGGLMKDAWLLRNVDVQILEPGHRDNHQRHILPLPCTHTPQHLSSSWCLTMAPLRTLQPSDHCVFQGCSNLTVQNDCTSALANSCFLLHTDFLSLSTSWTPLSTPWTLMSHCPSDNDDFWHVLSWFQFNYCLYPDKLKICFSNPKLSLTFLIHILNCLQAILHLLEGPAAPAIPHV